MFMDEYFQYYFLVKGKKKQSVYFQLPENVRLICPRAETIRMSKG